MQDQALLKSYCKTAACYACVMVGLMSTSPPALAATLADIQWMSGGWRGSLGPQNVEEAWSKPVGGTMATMIRLSSATETYMIELAVIREEHDSLVLHLRQFTPQLELLLAQDMPLNTLTPDRVSFLGPSDGGIKMLAYRRTSTTQMEVDVTIADGTVVTAQLTRE